MRCISFLFNNNFFHCNSNLTFDFQQIFLFPFTDRLGRSMPNLNKRGIPPPGAGVPRRAPSANPSGLGGRANSNHHHQPQQPAAAAYGLSRQHQSDPRLLARAGMEQRQQRNLPHHGYRGGRATASAEVRDKEEQHIKGNMELGVLFFCA